MIEISRRALIAGAGLAVSPLGQAPWRPARAATPTVAPIAFIGVNTGANAAETNQPEVPSTYMQAIGLGANIFRIYAIWQLLQPQDGGPLDPAALQALETQVSYATADGGVAVIDIHNYGERGTNYTVQDDVPAGATSVTLTGAPVGFVTGSTVTGTGITRTPATIATIVDGSPVITLSQPVSTALTAGSGIYLIGGLGVTYPSAYFTSFWTMLAQTPAFANRSDVWFGLMNEPAGTRENWTTITNATVAAIRSVGVNNMISVSYAPGGSIYILDLDYQDPRNALIYEIHFYGDTKSSGSGPVSTPTIYTEALTLAVNTARAQKQMLFLGECGFDQSSTSQLALAGMLTYLQRNTDVLKAITFWYDGAAFSDSYLYQIGASDGVFPPQVEVIRQFLPGGTTRGVAEPAPVYPLTVYGGSTAAQYTSLPSFGGKTLAMIATATQIYSKFPTSYTQASTAEGLISLPSPPVGTRNVWGNSAYHALQVTSAGTILVLCGSGTTAITLHGTRNICDGLEHRIEVNCGPKGVFVFIDGMQEVLDKTPFADTNPLALRWGVGDVGQQSSNYAMWLGTLREHALWAEVRHLRNYQPSNAPYTGMEQGLIGYWDLNGSLNGFC